MRVQNRTQGLRSTLEDLVAGTPDITGRGQASKDGLIIGPVLLAGVDGDSVGGMASNRSWRRRSPRRPDEPAGQAGPHPPRRRVSKELPTLI
jgi:hypothetical protein